MMDQLRNLNMDRIDMDDAVALLAFGRTVVKTYEENSLETPEWLKESIAQLEREVKARRRDNLERALKNARARRDSLKTAEEKRATLDEEIARITKALE